MICCKIVTNLRAPGSDLTKLTKKLSNLGDFLFDGGNLFFSDTEGDVDVKKVRSALKSSGYKDFYINIYDKDNEPVGETEDVIAWLANKIYKINYLTFERESQEILKSTLKGIRQLDEEFEAFKKTEEVNKKQEETSDK